MVHFDTDLVENVFFDQSFVSLSKSAYSFDKHLVVFCYYQIHVKMDLRVLIRI